MIRNNIFLVFGIFPTASNKYFNTVLQNTSDLVCKIWAFCRFFFPAMSVWLLAILTIERSLVVAFPFKQSFFLHKKRLCVILILLLTSHLAWCSFIVFAFSLRYFCNDKENILACACHPGIHIKIIFPVRIFVDQLSPVICVVLGNIVISVCFWRNSRQLSSQATANRASDSKLLLTTFSVSLAFIVLSIPHALYMSAGGKVHKDENYIAPYTALYILTDSIVYTNYGINFYLYVAFTDSFRKTVFKSVAQKFCRKVSRGSEDICTASGDAKTTEFALQSGPV